MLAVAPLTLAAYRAGCRRNAPAIAASTTSSTACCSKPSPVTARYRLRCPDRCLARTRHPHGRSRPQDRAAAHAGSRSSTIRRSSTSARCSSSGSSRASRWATRARSTRPPPDSPLPAVAADLGALLLAHLRVYGERLPMPALMSSFAALMAIGIFTFSLRADAAARELLRAGTARSTWPMESRPPSPLELYCDFTGDLGSESDRLSRALRRARSRPGAAGIPRPHDVRRRREGADPHPGRAGATGTGSRPQAGWCSWRHCASHRRVESYAEAPARRPRRRRAVLERMRPSPNWSFLRHPVRRQRPSSTSCSTSLSTSTRTRPSRTRWRGIWSVGGLEKPYGLLRGDVRNRRSWRYAPGDELLTALLLAVFVERQRHSPAARRCRCATSSTRCAHRFGILIDRPPAFLDGAEAARGRNRQPRGVHPRLQLLGLLRQPLRRLLRAGRPPPPRRRLMTATPPDAARARRRLDRRADRRRRWTAARTAIASASTASGGPTPHCSSQSLRDRLPYGAADVHVLVDRHGEADGKLPIPAERAVELRNRKERPLVLMVPVGSRLGRELAGQQLRPDRRHRPARPQAARPSVAALDGRRPGGRRPAGGARAGPQPSGRGVGALRRRGRRRAVAGRRSAPRCWMVGLIPDLGGPELVGRLARNAACVRAISRPARAGGFGRRPAHGRRAARRAPTRDADRALLSTLTIDLSDAPAWARGSLPPATADVRRAGRSSSGGPVEVGSVRSSRS